MKGKLTIICDIIRLHTCNHTHIGCAHEDSVVKEDKIAFIQGLLLEGIVQWRQTIWRLRIGYVLVSFAYDSVRQLAEYWTALVRRVFVCNCFMIHA